MTTTKIEDLEKQIDDLIRSHIAEVRRKAAAAMERAFAAANAKPVRPAPKRGTASPRRKAGELAEVGDRLYEAVCRDPGATLTTLAKAMGARTRDLEHPAKLLRRAGRVRCVGERNATRYFPMATKSS